MTEDQRWLLLHMGTWQIVHALCSPEGVKDLMTSQWGSSGGRRGDAQEIDGCPSWIEGCGWETSGGVVYARSRRIPAVKIKAADINRYASRLPADIKAELIACRNAGTANAVLRGRFCHCRNHGKSYPYQKDRICPPTEEQEHEATDEYWRIVDWQKRILVRALGFGESVGQLELFGAAG